MRAVAAALALVACAPAPAARSPITSATAPPGPPAVTAAPTVTWSDDGRIDAAMFPVVARDGSLVVIAHEDNDSGRGNPNLTLVARDRGDAVVKQLVVLTVADYETLVARPTALRARFDAANRWLAELHASKHLAPLARLEPSIDHEDNERHSGHGDGVTISWVPSTLRIQLDGGGVTTRPTPASWLALDHPMYAGASEICHNDAFMGAVAIARRHAIAVVTISYMGTDTCWEPSDQEHVITW